MNLNWRHARYIISLLWLLSLMPATGSALELALPWSVQVQDAQGVALANVQIHVDARRTATDSQGVAVFTGLASGSHQVRIEHPGYQRLEQSVTLSAAERAPLAIRLKPAPVLNWSVVLLVEPMQTPLPGARVELTLLDSHAALAGSAQAVSDWEGRANFTALAVGRYRLRVTAPGFLPLEREVNTEQALAPLSMQRQTQAAEVALQVVDAVSDKPLAAQIVLAETQGSGVIANAQSNAQGQWRSQGLRLGALNWPDQVGQLSVARRRVTALVSAEDYVSAVVPLSLGGTEEAAQRVRLQPVTEQPEQEPNDSLNTAQPIRLGAPVRFALERAQDHDVFRLTLPYPARLGLNIGPNNPLETLMRLYNAQGQLLREQPAYSNSSNQFEQVLPAGDYLIEISEWGENVSSSQAMRFTTSVQWAVDAREPNDQPETASPVALYEHSSGLIWPRGDVDYYALTLERPGILRLRDQAVNWERLQQLFNAEGKLVYERAAYANQVLDGQAQLPAGRYVLAVREWGDDNTSLQPYRWWSEFLPDDGVDDPVPEEGKPVRALRSLALGQTIGSTLLPNGDQDLYHITLPSAGTLVLDSQGQTERLLRLYDRQGRRLAEVPAYANNPLHVEWSANAAESVYVQLREWGDDHSAASAYQLSAYFSAADEWDVPQRNDRFNSATPITLGEMLYGSILPVGDQDVYLLNLELPAKFSWHALADNELLVRLYSAQQQLLSERPSYARQANQQTVYLNAGQYYLSVQEWGDNAAAASPYQLNTQVLWAEPLERWPLADDPVRRLQLGEAHSFRIDQPGDRDRFTIDLAQPGEYSLQVAQPLETLVRVYDDRSGALLKEQPSYAPTRMSLSFKFEQPTRLRIELREWGDNSASEQDGWVMLDQQSRPLQAAQLRFDTTKSATPLRQPLSLQTLPFVEAADSCEARISGHANSRVKVSTQTGAQLNLPELGRYQVESLCQGTQGQTAKQIQWLQVTAPSVRQGLLLTLNQPSEGQLVEQPLSVQASALSYDGLAIARVEFWLDGQRIASDASPPYSSELQWSSLASGEHTLTVRAYDAQHHSKELQRRFKLSEYFALTPDDGAVLSGETVTVSWLGSDFGSAKVRYREQGSENWHEVTGENARLRRVVLNDLEAGKTYEVQALDGKTTGPLRTLTRVKGLAFGKARYGANIRRDYNQQVGISVRNNGEQPLNVRLECGQPQDPLLLVGFVGEGSQDKPFTLQPGEEREFLLGISAQDVLQPEQRVPLRIVAENGLSDSSELALHVQLPELNLEWQSLGPSADGRGQRLLLINQGDAITDLKVYAQDAKALQISPTVVHGLLPAGARQEFQVSPRLYDGFTAVSTEVIAQGLDKRFSIPYQYRLQPGESVRQVWLFPGLDPRTASTEQTQRLQQRAQQAAQLQPEGLDWRNAQVSPERWQQQVGEVYWVGESTRQDGQVNFVHADVGGDGIFEYSALYDGKRWQPTNLVEAWLEMGFSLPWARERYQPHDAEIVFNDTVIGRIEQSIPEGNYSFRIPAHLLRFDASGQPASNNHVGIRSSHLRGGHYVVNSDFRFKFRLTATPVWTVAKSEAEAREQAAQQSGLSLSTPDLSLSSAELQLNAPPNVKAGDKLSLQLSVRNLGAAAASDTPIVVQRLLPNGEREELARVMSGVVGLDSPQSLSLEWLARGGDNRLSVVIDPEQQRSDADRSNNQANLFLKVAGDNTLPTLKVLKPAPNSVLKNPLVLVQVEANDDSESALQASVSIDGGLWQTLAAFKGSIELPLLLQNGQHQLQLRVLDLSGNAAQVTLPVEIQAPLAAFELLQPTANAQLDSEQLEVVLKVSADTRVVGARLAGGPWYKGVIDSQQQAQVRVPLAYGAQTLEVLVADAHGSVATRTLALNNQRQPTAKSARAANTLAEQGLLWPVTHPELEIDLFQATSGLLKRAQQPPSERAALLLEQARRLQGEGRYAAALVRYRESLAVQDNPQVRDRVKKLEVYLQQPAE